MNENEKVAIVIPCFNEEKYIGKCIESIIKNDFPKDNLEVIICDGLSTDKTLDEINKYTSKNSYIKVLNNKNKTTPFALNIGIKSTNADIIIILGAHSEIYDDYISKCVEKLNIYSSIGVECVGGIVENCAENKKSKLISLAMSSKFAVGNISFRTGGKDGFVDTVGAGAYKRDVFDKIGYFDEELTRNQDDELNFRLTKNGYKIFFSNEIKYKYHVRASFDKLYKQYFQYGFWKVYVNKKHNTITTIRQIVPFLFVVFLITGSIASIFSKIILLIFTGILLIYLFLAFVSAIKLTKFIGEIVLIIFTFVILHISYGSGYLKGIIDFIIFNKTNRNKYSSITR